MRPLVGLASPLILPSRVHHLVVLLSVSPSAVLSIIKLIIFVLSSLLVAIIVIATVAAVPPRREASAQILSIHGVMIVPAGRLRLLAILGPRCLHLGVHPVDISVDIIQI